MKFSIFSQKSEVKRIHLDYASTTPVRKEVLSEMLPYFSEKWANASAIYKEGVAVRTKIEAMREELARVVHVRASGVTFTSGGTESNNSALIGTVEALHKTGRAYSDMEIISTAIEHPSVSETLTYLKSRGVRVMLAPITEEGSIDLKIFPTLLSSQTVLVTFAYANSEVGVVQDVKKITRMVRLHNQAHGTHTLVHIDASQAPLWLPCEMDALGVDLMTLDAGKCYGPKGVGVLAHRHGVSLSPALYGGGQEAGLRSGTENTALIVGCVRALVRAQKEWKSRSAAAAALRDAGIALIKKEIPTAILNGNATERIANNINISIPGLDTEYATIWLDQKGICVATRSACGSGKGNGSQVVREMTHDETRATSTLRLTLGEETTIEDIKKCVEVLKDHMVRMKAGK